MWHHCYLDSFFYSLQTIVFVEHVFVLIEPSIYLFANMLSFGQKTTPFYFIWNWAIKPSDFSHPIIIYYYFYYCLSVLELGFMQFTDNQKSKKTDEYLEVEKVVVFGFIHYHESIAGQTGAYLQFSDFIFQIFCILVIYMLC